MNTPSPGSPPLSSLPRATAHALAAEWTRLHTVPATWWCLAGTTAVVVAMGTAFTVEASGNPSSEQPPAWVAGEFALLPAQFVLSVLVLLAITSEYATGAISTTLQWTPRRAVLLLARTVVPSLVAVTSGVVLAVGADLAAWAGSSLKLPLAGLAASITDIVLALTTVALLTVGLGFLLRSTAAALATMSLLLLVLPLVLPFFGLQWLQTLAHHLPGSAVLTLLQGVGPAGADGPAPIPVLLAWSSAAMLAGSLAFLRRDAG